MVKNTEASRAYWHVRVTGDNKGLAGQDIYVEISTGYFYKKTKARPNMYGSGNDGGGYEASFSVEESLMSENIQALATAEDKSQAGVENIWWGPDDVNIEMCDIGLSTAYLDVYATNRINQPVTFSVHKGSGGYGSALGTFTVEANAKSKKVGTVSEDNFITNTQNPVWFSARWGESYWEKQSYPDTTYGLRWGAGVGGPADFGKPAAYFYVGTPQPTLSGCSVTPLQGDTNTNFSFTVTYKHSNENEIGTMFGMSIYIDGNKYSMTKVSGTETTGIKYIYNTTLGEGQHQYYFSATWKVGPTDSETFNGPIVDKAPPPPPEPAPKVILTPQQQYDECYANRTKSYRITVENRGNKDGNFTLSALNGNDWITKILNDTGAVISSTTQIGLNIKESKLFFVNITVPNGTAKDSVVNTVVSAKVGATTHSTANITTTVKEFPGVLLSIVDSTEKEVEQGGEEKYLMEVKNEYDSLNNVSLSAYSVWKTSIVGINDSPLPQFLNMSPGSSEQFYVKVTSPNLIADNISTYGGNSASINVVATSNTLNKNATVSTKATVKSTSNITIVPISPTSGEQKGLVGKEIWYIVEARNNGNRLDVLDNLPSYGTLTNWNGRASIYKDKDGSLFSNTNEISGMDTGIISVNGSVNIFVKVKVPEDASDGDVGTITIKGKPASDPSKEINVTLKAIAETPGITIQPKELNGSGIGEQSVFYLFDVSNKQTRDEKLEIRCSSSTNSTVKFIDYFTDTELKIKTQDSSNISELPMVRNDEKTIGVFITLPPSLLAGSNDITTITVKSPTSGKFDTLVINTTILPVAGIDIALKNITVEGATTTYTWNITNTGNMQDTINVQYSSTRDWKVSILWENGITLKDTNNDTFVDIGKLTPQETRTIKTIASIPPNIDAGLPNNITLITNSSNKQEYYVNRTFSVVTSTDVAIKGEEMYIVSQDKRIGSTFMNGTNITVNAIVRNIGTANLVSKDGLEVKFYLGVLNNETQELEYTSIGNTTISNLSVNSSITVLTTYTINFTSVDKVKIVVLVEPLYDKNISNNKVEKNVTIKYSSAISTDVGGITDYTVVGVTSGLLTIGAMGAVAAFLFKRRELL
jgi:hypothetical protein